jgi:hypothetical protein
MKNPPGLINGARVIQWSAIDRRHRPTQNCRQIVAGQVQGPAAGLAICRYEDDDAYYLFGCDPHWNQITDTWHPSLEAAMEQAEFEYEGVSATWRSVI